MIADDAKIGARVLAPWGSTYRVHRVDGGRVVLADLDRPSAYVIRAVDRLGDLVLEVPRIPVSDSPGPTHAAAGSHARPSPPSGGAAAGNVAELHDGPGRIPRAVAAAPHLSPAPRLVLGAIPPGQPYSSTLGLPYWAPCLSRAIGEDGAPTADPHAWYARNAASAEDRASWHCPTCRDEFAGDAEGASTAIAAPAPVAAPPAPPLRIGPPRPIWLRPGLAAEVAAELLEWWHERAAIVEFDGGEPRPVADAIAYELLLAREERSAA